MLVSGMIKLPNLRTMDMVIMPDNIKLANYLWTFLNPKFVSLSVHVFTGSIGAHRMLQALVESLPLECPGIEKLVISAHRDGREDASGWQFSDSLARASIGLASTLTTLITEHTPFDTSTLLLVLSKTNYVTSLRAVLASGQTDSESARDRVPTELQILALDVEDIQSGINLLKQIHSPNLHTIMLRIFSAPRSDIQDLGIALLDSGCSALLTSVTVTWGRKEIEEQGPAGPESAVISKDMLAPFLRFSHIQTFSISDMQKELAFDFPSSFLQDISRAWPELESLKLSRPSKWDFWRPNTKLADLFDFIVALPELEILRFDVDFDCNDEEYISNHPYPTYTHPPSNVSLNVGFSTARHPTVIAAVLSELFREIRVNSSWVMHLSDDEDEEAVGNHNAWEEMQASLEVLTRVRLLERYRVFEMPHSREQQSS